MGCNTYGSDVIELPSSNVDVHFLKYSGNIISFLSTVIGMAKLRRDTHESQFPSLPARSLRIVASGTLFVTHTLSVPSHPAPSSVVRAHSVEKSRGGSAATLVSLLAQFPGTETALVAPLGGNDEGTMIIKELEREGVSTRYCKAWKGLGVPSAWVLQSGASRVFRVCCLLT